MKRYILAMDQGTTSSRAILFDHEGRVAGIARHELPQIYPKPGWVEHDPREIASTQLGAMSEVLISSNVLPDQIEAIGITNQRETTIVWDRITGQPIHNAIVWQCRRTTEMIDELCSDKAVYTMIREKTGLVPDAYFSASKIKWLLDNVAGARALASAGRLAFGTVDTWLIWVLTQGKVHATDVTNASRTMLFNIHTGQWDQELLDLFDIPASILPEVRPSSADYGKTNRPGLAEGIPICGVAGDQQAALFGQCCFTAGRAKNTYGTGCFLLLHTGHEPVHSNHGLITTIAASAPGLDKLEYALEGSVFMAGALLVWLQDLGLINNIEETERLARAVDDTAGVVVVPAFTGLGAPYWDADARGAVFGLTRATKREHVVRATLEAMAYQVHDVARCMEEDAGFVINELNVDGGVSVNNLLMQIQSDILHAQINRPKITESTAAGAAYLAGLYTGYWKDVHEIRSYRPHDEHFVPQTDASQVRDKLAKWHDSVERTKTT